MRKVGIEHIVQHDVIEIFPNLYAEVLQIGVAAENDTFMVWFKGFEFAIIYPPDTEVKLVRTD